MKQLVVLVGCCAALSGLTGCGRQNEKISNRPESGLAGQTQQEASGEVWQDEAYEDPHPDFFGDQSERSAFPDFLVGVWEVMVNEYSGSKWGFKFEPDGSISKIIHSLAGPINIAEGGVNAGTEEAYYIFVMGPCEARYIAKTRMLKVKIIVDYFIMKLPAGELAGRIEDYFEGAVSEDGKTWRVNWRRYNWLEGADPPDINLKKAHPISLVFTKLDLTQIRQEDGVQ